MPYLSVQTNVSLSDDQKPAVLAELSRSVADLLGKPESYVMVALDDGRPMRFAGSDAATAYLQLKSLGLPEDKCGAYSATLCQLIQSQFGIDTDRIYIEFSSPSDHMWGWDMGTF